MAQPKKYKLNIFDVLSKISTKDTKFFENLSEEEQKAVQPLVIMRWLTGTSSARQVFFLNELLNPMVFQLDKHKQLLLNLMTICCSGRSQRYQWNKPVSKKTSKTPTLVKVIKQTFGYNTVDALDALPILDNDTIMSYAESLGMQTDEIKLIKKELKTRG
jgi:hypothetical protein